MVADNPDQKIELKTFCSEIINDHAALSNEQVSYMYLLLISNVNQKQVNETYLQIKKDIVDIIHNEMERMLDTPELSDLIVQKNR